MNNADGTEPQHPRYVNALLSMQVLIGDHATQAPVSAAHWLADGWDGPNVLRLATLTGEDPFDVREAARDALDEMGIFAISEQDACKITFDTWATACLHSELDVRDLARQVETVYLAFDYADWVSEQPLGDLHSLDDEWEGKWGRTPSELSDAIISACRRQLDI